MFADRTVLLPIGRDHKAMQPLTRETPDFIAATLWPANGPDLNPVDSRICGKLQEHARFMMLTSWSCVWSKSGNISTRWSIDHRWSNRTVTLTSSSLHLSMWRIYWTQTLNMIDFCSLTVTCFNVANSGHFMFSGDLAKLAVTFADVDKFHWNLVFCLQLGYIVCQSYENVYIGFLFPRTYMG